MPATGPSYSQRHAGARNDDALLQRPLIEGARGAGAPFLKIVGRSGALRLLAFWCPKPVIWPKFSFKAKNCSEF